MKNVVYTPVPVQSEDINLSSEAKKMQREIFRYKGFSGERKSLLTSFSLRVVRIR